MWVLLLLPHWPAHCLNVILLSTSVTFLGMCQELSGGTSCCIICSCPPSCLPQVCCGPVFFVCCLMTSRAFASFISWRVYFCTFVLPPYVPIAKHPHLLYPQCLLVWQMFLRISFTISFSFIPLMNCFVSNMLYFLVLVLNSFVS